MKIVHVAPSIARRDGGPPEVLRGLLPAQAALGHDVHLIVTDKDLAEGDLDGVEEMSTLVRWRRPHSWWFAPGVVGELRKHAKDADMVHIHGVHTFPSTAAMIVCRRMGVPYVVEPHGALTDYQFGKSSLKKVVYTRVVDAWGARGLSGVVVSSDLEAEGAVRYGEVALPVVPLGVDPGLFDIERRPTDQPTVLFLGRLAAKKRVDLLLRALAEPPLVEAGATALIAGPVGEDLPYDPFALADELGVRDRVTFLGQVDRTERRDLLARASVFLLASDDESFGVAVAEALGAGCPTVVSSQVGLAEAARKADALVVTSQEPSEIADAVGALLADPEGAAALGRRGRAHAQEEFTWVTAASRADQAYGFAPAVR